jgi:hypothetical protein
MIQGISGEHQALFAIADAAVIFAPSHLAGVGRQIFARDATMNANFSAARRTIPPDLLRPG